MANDEDIYGVLGQSWWEKTGEEVKATPQQVRFAAARFTVSSRSKAAAQAGYAGDAQALRSAGSRVDDTALAATAGMGGVNPVTVGEAKEKVGKLVRSLDSGVALKAAELFCKLEAAEKERGTHPEDDGFGEWRICRDYLTLENGASQFMLFYRAAKKDLGHAGNFPLLHDVHSLAQNKPFGIQIWNWCNSNLSEEMKNHLYGLLSNPDWQLEARQKIWGEIGVRLDDRGHFAANAA
jgi:hypothetical protein